MPPWGNSYREPKEEVIEITDNAGEAVFTLPYDADGRPSAAAPMRLDLREGARVTITRGPYRGCTGEVVQWFPAGGYWKMRFLIPVKNLRAPFTLQLGRWWVEEAQLGLLAFFPVAPESAATLALS